MSLLPGSRPKKTSCLPNFPENNFFEFLVTNIAIMFGSKSFLRVTDLQALAKSGINLSLSEMNTTHEG